MSHHKQNKLKNLPQNKPLLLFDGDCHFCRYWVLRWKFQTEHRVDYAPYQDKAVEYPEIPLDDLKRSVHLINPSGDVYTRAEAVFRLFKHVPGRKWIFDLSRVVPGFLFISNLVYDLVARRRPFFSKLTRLAWGNEIRPATYILGRSLFLKMMALIYFVAYASMWVQITGLIGKNGILPIEQYFQAVSDHFGFKPLLSFPTIFWIDAGNVMLKGVCLAGMALSAILFLGWAAPLALALLWFLYLSIVIAGQNFMSFQWDILLLEAGFLSIFLAPFQIKPGIDREAFPSKLIIFLFHLLLFKLVFSSGMVKILSLDKSWADLTALTFHYETQPLPTWISWLIHQAPIVFQKMSLILMFAIELVFPFFIFLPRRLRYAGCLAQAALQVLVILTGNYGFFNFLTLALCVLLLDDSFFSAGWQQRLARKRDWSREFPAAMWPKWIHVPVFVFILSLTCVTLPQRLGINIAWPSIVRKSARAVAPFRFVNNYGLFAVMTTSRPEIIVEGSVDGDHWKAYEFKYKPGTLDQRPVFVAPHMPRLDWQMWFAALGHVRQNPWFFNFCLRLLQGEEAVLRLLESNPFPDIPPRYLRARMYDYHFTTIKELRETGHWWRRSDPRIYLPSISLKN